MDVEKETPEFMLLYFSISRRCQAEILLWLCGWFWIQLYGWNENK